MEQATRVRIPLGSFRTPVVWRVVMASHPVLSEIGVKFGVLRPIRPCGNAKSAKLTPLINTHIKYIATYCHVVILFQVLFLSHISS